MIVFTDWEGFEALEEVVWTMNLLGSYFDPDKLDWKAVIGDHTYFAGLPNCSFPPLYLANDFEELGDFLYLQPGEEDLEEEPPGQSYTPFRLCVDASRKDFVVDSFASFQRYLRSLTYLKKIF